MTRVWSIDDDGGPAHWEEEQGGPGGVQVATLALTDAQIKALPTTPVVIVPGQGPGTLVMPLLSIWSLDASAGGYDGFNNDPTNRFSSSVYLAWDALNNFNDASGAVVTTQFLGNAARNLSYVGAISGYIDDIFTATGSNDGNESAVGVSTDNGFDNADLFVVGQNNGGAPNSDFTGGDPANVLRVTVLYVVADL